MNIFLTIVFNSEIHSGSHHIYTNMDDFNSMASNIANLFEKFFLQFYKNRAKKEKIAILCHGLFLAP
jgi:hypothetical protein